MADIKIPKEIKQMLASEDVRTFHHLWHFVRDKESWESLSNKAKKSLEEEGWTVPPRFEQELGSGLDFFYMHRVMIEMVNEHLHHVQGNYKKVEGWNTIPFNHNDSDYPMPSLWTGAHEVFEWAKNIEITKAYEKDVKEKYRNNEWLKRELDAVGREIESTIHGWMHLHWSAQPKTPSFDNSVNNDWLGAPYSSHVNDIFWKLHGWVDNTITLWEKINGKKADFSSAWAGPTHDLPHPHSANPHLLKVLKIKEKSTIKIMTWKVPIVEGVNTTERVIKEIEKL